MSGLITSSSCKAFRRCPRYYKHRYVNGVVGTGRAATLERGTAVHAGLETWFRTGDLEHAIIDATRGVADPYEVAYLDALLTAYAARWGDEPLVVLAVEAEFRGALVNPATGACSRTWQRAGKIDAIVRDPAGLVWVLEHKTASEDITPGGDYWKRLRLEGQASDYLVGARMLGFEPAGVLYDVIGKPRVVVRRATPEADRRYTKDGRLYAQQCAEDESVDEYAERVVEKLAAEPDRYFVRGVVARNEEDERDAAFDVWATAQMIRECERAERWARNPQACVMWGRTCDYFAACSREASIDDPILFRRERPHRELSVNPASEETIACNP